MPAALRRPDAHTHATRTREVHARPASPCARASDHVQTARAVACESNKHEARRTVSVRGGGSKKREAVIAGLFSTLVTGE